MLLVRHPDESLHHEFPKIEVQDNQIAHWSGSVSDILNFVRANTDLMKSETDFTEPSLPAPNRLSDTDSNLSIDIAGWGDVKTPENPAVLFGGQTTLGNHPVVWRVVRHQPEFTAIRPMPKSGIIDDREMLRNLHFSLTTNLRMINTGKFSGLQKAEWVGTHLFFKFGYSHPAQTIRAMDKAGELCWIRQYVLMLPNPMRGPGQKRNVAFGFVFQFYGPFRAFASSTKHMDQMVDSTEWPRLPKNPPHETFFGKLRTMFGMDY